MFALIANPAEGGKRKKKSKASMCPPFLGCAEKKGLQEGGWFSGE